MCGGGGQLVRESVSLSNEFLGNNFQHLNKSPTFHFLAKNCNVFFVDIYHSALPTGVRLFG